MKKLLLLITCACIISIHAMESELDNQTVPLDKQIQGYTVSTIKEFKRFFNTEPDPNKVPSFEFGQLTPDDRVAVLTEATRQHQALKVITRIDLLLKREPSSEDIFYPRMLQKIKDGLEPIVPTNLIYDKKVSTFSDFQTFFEKQPDLNTIIKFKFSKLTADERAKIFQEAEEYYQELEGLVARTAAGGKISGFKITLEIILYLEMLKKITDNLAPESPTK